MNGEHMSQDEIDSLMKDITSGRLEVDLQASGGGDKNEAHRVKTALARLQFAQESGMSAEEVRYRSWYLKDAAHALWLKHHGLTRKEWQDKVHNHFMLHPEHYQLLVSIQNTHKH